MTDTSQTPFRANHDPFSLVRERDLAERWNKSLRTLQRWRSAGYGPAYLQIGGTVRYRLRDILAFEELQRHGGRK